MQKQDVLAMTNGVCLPNLCLLYKPTLLLSYGSFSHGACSHIIKRKKHLKQTQDKN